VLFFNLFFHSLLRIADRTGSPPVPDPVDPDSLSPADDREARMGERERRAAANGNTNQRSEKEESGNNSERGRWRQAEMDLPSFFQSAIFFFYNTLKDIGLDQPTGLKFKKKKRGSSSAAVGGRRAMVKIRGFFHPPVDGGRRRI
jgi:hypothetical protein